MKQRYMLPLIVILGFFLVLGCEDDTATGPDDTETDVWVGNWLSAGDNVAGILYYYYSVDSIEVEFTEDGTVTLNTHYDGVGWAGDAGTYAVTESATGDIHSFAAEYTVGSFSQEGIIQVISGSPDTLKLEVVQTIPSIGATVPSPALGFGADSTLGTLNIQTYIRVE